MMDMQRFLTVAETATPEAIFAALEAFVMQEVGAVIFSCSTFDTEAANSRRIYTNLPDIYPVSGLKDIIPNSWTAQVLDRRQPFVANTLAEIREVFPDHEIIGSLGCGSVINMPVYLAGKLLGTVNILHEPGYYTPARLEKLLELRPAAMLTFASHTA